MKRRLSAKDVESLENTSIGGVLAILDTGVTNVTTFICVANTTPICEHGTGVGCQIDSICHETAECTIVVCTNSCHDTCCAYDSTGAIRPALTSP